MKEKKKVDALGITTMIIFLIMIAWIWFYFKDENNELLKIVLIIEASIFFVGLNVYYYILYSEKTSAILYVLALAIEYLNYTSVSLMVVLYYTGSIPDPLIFLGGGALLTFITDNIVLIYSKEKKEQVEHCLSILKQIDELCHKSKMWKCEFEKEKTLIKKRAKNKIILSKKYTEYLAEMNNLIERNYSDIQKKFSSSKSRIKEIRTELELDKEKYSSWKRKFLILIMAERCFKFKTFKNKMLVFLSIYWAPIFVIIFIRCHPVQPKQIKYNNHQNMPILEEMRKINNLKRSQIIFIKEQK